MPPVLGPVSPSPTRLKSWAGVRATARVPSQIAKTDTSGPIIPSSMTTVRPASPNDAAGELRPHVGLRLGEILGDEHALAGRQPVGLHHPGRRQRCGGSSSAGSTSSKVPCRAVGTSAADRQLLHVGLRALDLGAVGARARTRASPAARRRSASPSTSGCSGPITKRSASSSSGGVATDPGIPGFPGRDDDVRRPREHVGQSTPPAPRPHDDDRHSAILSQTERAAVLRRELHVLIATRGRRRGGGWARRPAARGRRRSRGPWPGGGPARWPR